MELSIEEYKLKAKGKLTDREDSILINCTLIRSSIFYAKLNFDTKDMGDMGWMFADCCDLINLDISSFNTKDILFMNYMFSGCEKLKDLDLHNFDTRNVIDMESMFFDCKNLKSLDLSSFDTREVEDMSWMFYHCYNLKELDLSNFTFYKVKKFEEMFEGVPNDCKIIVKDNAEKQWLLMYKEILSLKSENIKIKGE